MRTDLVISAKDLLLRLLLKFLPSCPATFPPFPQFLFAVEYPAEKELWVKSNAYLLLWANFAGRSKRITLLSLPPTPVTSLSAHLPAQPPPFALLLHPGPQTSYLFLQRRSSALDLPAERKLVSRALSFPGNVGGGERDREDPKMADGTSNLCLCLSSI